MHKAKKSGLGHNNPKSKLFYLLLVLIPSLQFFVFYICVNFNSFLLAFKEFPTGVVTEFDWGVSNFTNWFNKELMRTELLSSTLVSLKSYGIVLVTSVPLGLFFSYYMFKKMFGSKLFRVLLYMPSIISAAPLAVIYIQIMSRIIGGSTGIVGNIDFWDLEHRYGTMMFFCIFFSFGTNVLMYTNRMNGIAPEMIESAHIDGANGFKEFWYIVFPQTFSVVKVFLLTGFATIFTNQYSAMVLFGWNPKADVQPLGYLLWHGVQRAMGNVTQMGEYSALGLMLSAIMIPTTFFLRWVLNKIGWKED